MILPRLWNFWIMLLPDGDLKINLHIKCSISTNAAFYIRLVVCTQYSTILQKRVKFLLHPFSFWDIPATPELQRQLDSYRLLVNCLHNGIYKLPVKIHCLTHLGTILQNLIITSCLQNRHIVLLLVNSNLP